MTNKEKFIEVFGVEPDDDTCPLFCITAGNNCPYEGSNCYYGRWWKEEYEEKTDG